MKTLILAVLLSAQAHSQPQVKNPDTFTYAITGDVDSLDPHWQFDMISGIASNQIYEGLIDYAGSSVDAFEPRLSAQVPNLDNGLLSKDGLRYAFPIRKGVKFHDGSEMTAEDVKYSLMRFILMDRANGGSYLLLEPLLGVENAVGDDGKPDPEIYSLADERITIEAGAVVLHLEKPCAPLLAILAGYAPVLSKKWVIAQGGWDGRLETWPKFHDPPKNNELYDKADGTGPFRLERWDRQNRMLLFARNESYWREPAKLKRLVLRTVDEANTRKLMLQAGDADAVMAERSYLPQLESLEGVRVLDGLPLLETHNVFVMNFAVDTKGNPFTGSGKLDGDGIPADFFADEDVRRAFANSFNYDAYIRDVYRGKAVRARGPIPRGLFGHNARQPVYDFDLAKASARLKTARGGALWENGFRFTLTYMEGRSDRQVACQILKKGIESLNPKFKIDVRGVQWSTWLSAWKAGKIPMANTRWVADYPDAVNPAYAFLDSDGYYAKTQGYNNPRADRYIETAKTENDREARRTALYELQSLAYQDVPQIYTVDTFFFQVLRSWVKDWSFNPVRPYGNFYSVSKAQ